ncbi:MAG: hypothetical protein ACM3JD_03060 [Rudaea sp.]
MNSDELAALALAIVQDANNRHAAVRLCGGLAVYARCASIKSHPALGREHLDLQFIAPVDAWHVLPDLFISRGFRMRVGSREHATFKRGELVADVKGTLFKDYFQIDMSRRLMADAITLPLADLLLANLQRVQMGETDVQDSIALLLDHPVVSGGDSESIDRDYICWRTYSNWGLWTAVYDNAVNLEKLLDRYLPLKEAKRAWRGIESIQEVMDARHKTNTWWLRSLPGKRMKWYTVPPAPRPDPEIVMARPTKPIGR